MTAIQIRLTSDDMGNQNFSWYEIFGSTTNLALSAVVSTAEFAVKADSDAVIHAGLMPGATWYHWARIAWNRGSSYSDLVALGGVVVLAIPDSQIDNTWTAIQTYSVNQSNNNIATFENTGATNPYGIDINYKNIGSGGQPFLRCYYSNFGTLAAAITGNGSFQSATNSYGATSERALKNVIGPAGSQWEDVKALAALMSKFTLKADESGLVMLGLIADEVEAVSPGLIDRLADVRGIKYSVLYLKAVKALGEALERIEALEAKIGE